jgi:hypothetical protein
MPHNPIGLHGLLSDNFTLLFLMPTAIIIKPRITDTVLWVPLPQDIDWIPFPRWAEVRKVNNDHIWTMLNITK